ncbi:MAG TPA: hypothetical protein VFI06_10825 [Chitinophagaceae bacterium]|nr:hypothetical protein [Chitinophagaceae bacterium]
MNTWLKSLLIGVVVAGIAYFVFQRMTKQKTIRRFTAHYELIREAKPGTVRAGHDETMDDLHKMSQAIQARCKNAGYPIVVKTMGNDEKLDITIQHVDDTIRLRRLIKSTGKLEIHEVYTMQELVSVIEPSLKEPVQVSVETVPEENTVIDTGKAIKFSELKPEATKPVEQAPTLASIITFSQQPQGAEIGWIAEKDTAVFRKIFIKDLSSSMPVNARFYYGPGNSPSKRNLAVYALRSYGEGSIIIDNTDIKTAMQAFGYTGIPSVEFSFTSTGSRKWEMLTGKNVGRPLAILVDDKVISAPRVESAILGGKASISGGFTVAEAQALADQLSSGAMPASFHIIKQEISPETGLVNLKSLLIVLIAFAIGTGTSYLIFKLLKSN